MKVRIESMETAQTYLKVVWIGESDFIPNENDTIEVQDCSEIIKARHFFIKDGVMQCLLRIAPDEMNYFKDISLED